MRFVASMISRFRGYFVEGHIWVVERAYMFFSRCCNGCEVMYLSRRVNLQHVVIATCIYIHTDGHTTIYTPKPSNLHTPSAYFIHSSDQRHLQPAIHPPCDRLLGISISHPTRPLYHQQLSPPSLGIPDPSSGVAKCTLRSALPTFSSTVIGSGN